jgi:Ca2+-binding EF-hand superfamily protein
MSKDELADYVKSHAELWAMLGVNLNMEEARCCEIATNVAFALAMGQADAHMPSSQRRELTKAEFHNFRTNYVLDPKGSEEFFHMALFATFDGNGNGVLEPAELDKFLDIFYEADSIFKGDKRLPTKKKLLKEIFEKLDTDNDGVLSFEEIRGLIGGQIDDLGISETTEKSKPTKKKSISKETTTASKKKKKPPEETSKETTKTSKKKKKPPPGE